MSPAATTFTSTSPGPGSGAGNRMSSGSPAGFATATARTLSSWPDRMPRPGIRPDARPSAGTRPRPAAALRRLAGMPRMVGCLWLMVTVPRPIGNANTPEE
ncbi:hypothetical protein GCM10023205_45220 [Yinghuangia aomiensis]|uniref:Uncharacterized protein n=1 Tax=Yinghuangia aomiensis TaxID=676205 RepID=A0ABP9HM18_9ACTN